MAPRSARRARSDDAVAVSGEDIPFGRVDPGEPEERGYFAQPGDEDLGEPGGYLAGGGSFRAVKSGRAIAGTGERFPFGDQVNVRRAVVRVGVVVGRRRIASHTASTPYGSTSGQQAMLGRSVLAVACGSAMSRLSCGQFSATRWSPRRPRAAG